MVRACVLACLPMCLFLHLSRGRECVAKKLKHGVNSNTQAYKVRSSSELRDPEIYSELELCNPGILS